MYAGPGLQRRLQSFVAAYAGASCVSLNIALLLGHTLLALRIHPVDFALVICICCSDIAGQDSNVTIKHGKLHHAGSNEQC